MLENKEDYFTLLWQHNMRTGVCGFKVLGGIFLFLA